MVRQGSQHLLVPCAARQCQAGGQGHAGARQQDPRRSKASLACSSIAQLCMSVLGPVGMLACMWPELHAHVALGLVIKLKAAPRQQCSLLQGAAGSRFCAICARQPGKRTAGRSAQPAGPGSQRAGPLVSQLPHSLQPGGWQACCSGTGAGPHSPGQGQPPASTKVCSRARAPYPLSGPQPLMAGTMVWGSISAAHAPRWQLWCACCSKPGCPSYAAPGQHRLADAVR